MYIVALFSSLALLVKGLADNAFVDPAFLTFGFLRAVSPVVSPLRHG